MNMKALNLERKGLLENMFLKPSLKTTNALSTVEKLENTLKLNTSLATYCIYVCL